jgi:hypothetical protein
MAAVALTGALAATGPMTKTHGPGSGSSRAVSVARSARHTAWRLPLASMTAATGTSRDAPAALSASARGGKRP